MIQKTLKFISNTSINANDNNLFLMSELAYITLNCTFHLSQLEYEIRASFTHLIILYQYFKIKNLI